MDGEIVGCFRIFHPEAYPQYLELGSVVSKYPRQWIGIAIVSHAQRIAIQKNAMLIAITNWNLDSVLKALSWIEEDRWVLLKRMKEAPEDKKLWTFNSRNT